MIGTADPPRDDIARPSRRLTGQTMPLVPAVAALAVALAGIRGPSFWLDEAATISMAGRPAPEMLRAFDNLDLVHALYYLVMRPWVMVFGTGELAMRLPSALATAVAAAGVAAIGRRCLGPAAGLLAGLAYGGSVPVVRFAQEARPYAMVTAVAVLATYLLIRGMGQGGRRRWHWFGGYAAAIIVLALLNLTAVLLVPAHAGTLLMARAKATGTWSRWLVAGCAAGTVLLPFGLAAREQKSQVQWLPVPSWDTVGTLVQFLAGGTWLIPPVVVLAVIGSVAGRAARDTAPLTAVAAPWLLVPPLTLLAASILVEPVFMYRYVVFCLPGLALLIGAGLARLPMLGRSVLGRSKLGRSMLGRRAVGATALAAGVAAMALPSLPEHMAVRRQDSRPDDLRAPAQIVRDNARDGDAIVYLAGVVRWNAAAYPDVFGRLRDINMRQDPISAANLKGRDRFPRHLPEPLRDASRVWVMGSRSLGHPLEPPVLRRVEIIQEMGPWRVAGDWTYRGGNITLYVRTAPYRSSK